MSRGYGDTGGSSGPLCPACGSRGSQVKDSRPSDESVRRRRECVSCGLRYTTYESTDASIRDWAERQKHDVSTLSPEARAIVEQLISLLRAGEKKEKINGYQDYESPEGSRREDGFHPAA